MAMVVSFVRKGKEADSTAWECGENDFTPLQLYKDGSHNTSIAYIWKNFIDDIFIFRIVEGKLIFEWITEFMHIPVYVLYCIT